MNTTKSKKTTEKTEKNGTNATRAKNRKSLNRSKDGKRSSTKSNTKKIQSSGSSKPLPKNRNGDDRSEPQRTVLAIDIGGSKVKMLVNGQMKPRKAPTGLDFTPLKLLEVVKELTSDWKYDAVTIGFPGLVGPNGPLAEPGNLGPGWVGFDFTGAFECPVKILNDAAMQAVGSYEGGRMLFLGLGTGLGSTMIVEHVILTVELSCLRWNSRRTLGDLLSKKSIKKLGIEKWRAAVHDVVYSLMKAFVADYVVVGGGNAKLLNKLPAGARVGHNQTAFRGGFRVWGADNVSSENVELHGHWKIL
jgi:polyphosphate glucokinase